MKHILIAAAMFICAIALFSQDISLPAPATKAGVDLLSAINDRSVARAFVKKDLAPAELSTILWAAIGKRGVDATTSATKAGRTVSFTGDNSYINVYVLTEKGTYKYNPDKNVLEQTASGDSRATLTPEAIAGSAAVVLFTADNTKIPAMFKGNMAIFGPMTQATAGFAAQNLTLAASAYKLSSIVMYNLKPAVATTIAKLPKTESPLFLVQLGYTK